MAYWHIGIFQRQLALEIRAIRQNPDILPNPNNHPVHHSVSFAMIKILYFHFNKIEGDFHESFKLSACGLSG